MELLYFIGKTSKGREYFEKKFSRKLSNEELAYAVLVEYFDLRLDYMNFYRFWEAARRIYGQEMPGIAKIFDAAIDWVLKRSAYSIRGRLLVGLMMSVAESRMV